MTEEMIVIAFSFNLQYFETNQRAYANSEPPSPPKAKP